MCCNLGRKLINAQVTDVHRLKKNSLWTTLQIKNCAVPNLFLKIKLIRGLAVFEKKGGKYTCIYKRANHADEKL